MALVVQTAWRRRGSWDSALAIGLACVVAAAMHDYLYQIGRLSIMGGFWVPYAVPLIVAAYAALLLERLVLALSSTERMNITLEHRVLQRTRELQDANAAKARFLAAASHDLRQPMVSIGLLVGLLHEQLSSGPLQRVVQRLQEASAAMEQLLKRLLDLSRLQAGTVKVQRQAVPMQAFLTDVAARHVDHAQRKGLRLRVARTSAVVDADLVLLDQILSNLVGNAVRYTQSGGVLLGVRPAGASHWRVAVWDTGPGIPKSQHQAIFGEFVRGSQLFEAGDAQNGLGLGLAIVQRSAALMGTAAALRSQVGRGTCFSVMLPKARAQPLAMAEKTDTVHARPAAGIAEVREGAEAPLAGRRIWLLEDHGGARESMGMLLLHWGADLQVVDSLAAFQTALQNSAAAPDVVLSDHHLADGRGSTALLALRQRWPSARAVLVTGSTAPGELLELERWREAGVAVLLKPFASRELQAAVHQVLAAAPFRLPATGSSASEPQPAPPASGSRRPVCGKSRAGGS
jgi:signal transduction histidine kinase/DNA-binding NarL/FixJ family response regulator